ncbi:FecR family protein [Mucilaginibacter lappiensis]|uniref:Ferric-dicitrate binding protein FerR (Iron transport regulator) n=1 Tax=Mucilaginibacter lappiensis TaxID=354630 RepID=A0ABR6PSM6_9SPHI|nr:FecR family protein [Mucilaginibacter lappiensis]MBB6111960.1 ferric-dicitrate binding protein FerR (iron transport regulator) [Mucilaginibacter lappiensis]SIR91012.1 FecR family protein [Mucilaginibacter lappiensis]
MNNYQPYFDLGKLIAKYLRNELTEQENDQLEQWLQADMHNQELFRKLTDETLIDSELETFEANDKDKAWKNIVKKTRFKRISRKKSTTKKWPAYAAAIIILITIGVTLTRYRNTSGEQKMAVKPQKDLLPGSNKAILTLADGSKILLDDAKRGKIASQQNIVITKDESGELVYQVAETAKSEELPPVEKIVMNMLATPRGGQYQIVLPDGTRVWLNSASSLRYPTTFAGNERRVELNGEAYFEVSKDPNKPFYVKTTTQTVAVLGTHFNINSYPDEVATKTTLLEGSIRVTSNTNGATVKLKPGEQAVNTVNAIDVKENADIDEAVAWKNGKFLFRNTDLHTIMRQLSRWYDVDVEYQGNVVQKHYRGRISRNVPVSEIFQILKTSGINFTIDGRKIIVRS